MCFSVDACRPGWQAPAQPDQTPHCQRHHEQNHGWEQDRLAGDLQKQADDKEDQRTEPEEAAKDIEVLRGTNLSRIRLRGIRIHYLTAPAVSPGDNLTLRYAND
jgi:hypothetical protein